MKKDFEERARKILAEQQAAWDARTDNTVEWLNRRFDNLIDKAANAYNAGEKYSVLELECQPLDTRHPAFRKFRQDFIDATGVPDVTREHGNLVIWLKKPTKLRRAGMHLRYFMSQALPHA